MHVSQSLLSSAIVTVLASDSASAIHSATSALTPFSAMANSILAITASISTFFPHLYLLKYGLSTLAERTKRTRELKAKLWLPFHDVDLIRLRVRTRVDRELWSMGHPFPK